MYLVQSVNDSSRRENRDNKEHEKDGSPKESRQPQLLLPQQPAPTS